MSAAKTTNNNENLTMSDWLTFSKGLIKYIIVYLILTFWIGGSYIIYLNKLASLLTIDGDAPYHKISKDVKFFDKEYKFTTSDYLTDYKMPHKYVWTEITTLIVHYFYTSIFFQTVWVNRIIQHHKKHWQNFQIF